LLLWAVLLRNLELIHVVATGLVLRQLSLNCRVPGAMRHNKLMVSYLHGFDPQVIQVKLAALLIMEAVMMHPAGITEEANGRGYAIRVFT
jgi:hypothetical protein